MSDKCLKHVKNCQKKFFKFSYCIIFVNAN